MTRLRAACLSLALALALPAYGQERVSVTSPIVTIDAERLYIASAFGQRVEAEIAAEVNALANENRSIEEALTAEEQSLTDRRPTMDPERFRAEAAAFDARVQEIRTAQDAKELVLRQASGEGQRQFYAVATPILGEIMRERGATVILERRSVFGSLDAIDVTDAAIARVDAQLGDGAELTLPIETVPQDGASPFDIPVTIPD